MDALKFANISKPDVIGPTSAKLALGVTPTAAALLGKQISNSSAVSGSALLASASADLGAKLTPIIKARERSGVGRLQRMLADSIATDSIIKGWNSSVIDSMLKSIEKQFVRTSHLTADLNSFLSTSELIKANLGLPLQDVRPKLMRDLGRFAIPVTLVDASPTVSVAPVRLTPRTFVRPGPMQGGRIEDFLTWVREDLAGKYWGVFDALAWSRDGVSQAANSAAELLRHLLNELVPEADVWQRMTERGELATGKKRAPHPPWKNRLELLAVTYGLSEPDLTLLFLTPGLPKCAEDIKHDTHVHTRGELMRVLGGVEDFLTYLAARIDRSRF